MLEKFINKNQLKVLKNLSNVEEKELFKNILQSWEDVIKSMPKTYETDGKGDEAIAYLHYFIGGSNFYITEKDIEEEQYQAFGLASLNEDEVELGYISINELLECEVEFDLYWIPKPLKEIK